MNNMVCIEFILITLWSLKKGTIYFEMKKKWSIE